MSILLRPEISNAAIDKAIWEAELELEYRRRRAQKREEAREKYKRLRDFAQGSWSTLLPGTELKWGPAADAICEHLEAVSRNQIKKLIINIAPRHTKSILTSVNWPAWSWLEHPSLQWLFASYSLALSVDLSVDCRRLVESPWYINECLPDFVLSSDQDAKSLFDNSKRGSRFATAMTATSSGFGGDIVACDDAHNRLDANSPAAIKASVDGWKYNISVCLNDKINGRMVVIMQRVCTGDLTDVLLSEGGWEHLCLPTEYDGKKRSTSLGYYDWRKQKGELLFPERFDEKANKEAKKDSHIYSAQHAQNPTPDGGVVVDITKFKKIDSALIPKFLRKHRHWDLAATAETTGKDPDYTVGVLLGIDDGTDKTYVLDVVRFRKDAAGCEEEIKRVAEADGVEVSITLEEEKASAGKHVSSYYARRVLKGFVVKGQPIQGDKVARMRPFAAQVNVGNVYVPKDAEWLPEYFLELKDWPRSAHRDQGDGTSGSYNELTNPNSQNNYVQTFKLTADGKGIVKGPLISKLSVYGFISPDFTGTGFGAIIRLWVDVDGNCYLAEAVRKTGTVEQLLQLLIRMQEIQPFEAVGIDEEVYWSIKNKIENVEDRLPYIHTIERIVDRIARQRNALVSILNDGTLKVREQIFTGELKAQLVSIGRTPDELADATAGAIELVQLYQ